MVADDRAERPLQQDNYRNDASPSDPPQALQADPSSPPKYTDTEGNVMDTEEQDANSILKSLQAENHSQKELIEKLQSVIQEKDKEIEEIR